MGEKRWLCTMVTESCDDGAEFATAKDIVDHLLADGNEAMLLKIRQRCFVAQPWRESRMWQYTTLRYADDNTKTMAVVRRHGDSNYTWQTYIPLIMDAASQHGDAGTEQEAMDMVDAALREAGVRLL